MDQVEVLDWLDLLPYFQQSNLRIRRCENDTERIVVITDLLKHAGEDHMTVEDRTVCVEALEYLRQKNGVTDGEVVESSEAEDVQRVSEDSRREFEGSEGSLP